MKRIICGQSDEKVSVLERENREVAYEAALESFVLLKNDGCLPLKEKQIALFGTGATHTIKGGTGSGEVNNRHSISIYEGLKDAGFSISNERYLKNYIDKEAKAHEDWIKANKGMPSESSLSKNYVLIDQEKISEEDLGEGREVCLYVLSRQSGEAADKKLYNDDYHIKKNEIADLSFLKERYRHLIVLINSGSSLDLSPLEEMDLNLIFYGQAGQEGGRALADVLSGESYFSGKLSSTWAKSYEDIPFGDEFSYLNKDLDNEYYKEDIYVGYRYFDSFKVEPRFCFGYGLTYTSFETETTEAKLDGRKLKFQMKVTNTGGYKGKQVVQVYASCPKGKLDKEYQRLIAFEKTKELKPGEAEVLDLEVDMYGLSSYDENENVYLLEKGDYIIKVGDSSRNNKAVLVVENKEDIVLSKHDAICKTGEELNRLVNGNSYEYDLRGVKRAVLDPKDFVTETYVYGKPAVYSDEKVDAILNQMNEKDMIDVVTGIGTMGMMDTNCFCVPGIAGKTTYKHLDKGLISVTLADGPGGLRLVRKSAVSKSGRIKMFKGNYLLSFMEIMPDWMLFFLKPGKKDTVFYQYATAFPVGTNLAQTWNQKLVEKIGLSVSKEMDRYNITYWLAPGMNIHKNPLCGRNFEYYSEDPVLSGKISAAMTRGVQSIPGNYTTIKHFACNNAEDNRGLSDSHVSQRALREIYLKGFEINIKEAGSKSLMTAYNKINGIYCPDSFDLCTKVLRNEWGFDGVVMTDWSSTKPGQGHTDLAVANGNDMIMPGDKVDNKTLAEGLKKGTLSKEDLRRASANIIRSIVYSNAAKKYKAEDFR